MKPNLRFDALIVLDLADTELIFILGVSMVGTSVYCDALSSTFLAPDLLVGGFDVVTGVEMVGLERLDTP